jgi:hypothetical protein
VIRWESRCRTGYAMVGDSLAAVLEGFDDYYNKEVFGK